jgi:trigger factor
MPYTITTQAQNTVEVTAHLEPDAVSREQQKIVHEWRRRATLPGFRRGKAPLALVRSRFASEIGEELEEHLANLLWREVVDGEERFEPLTAPEIGQRGFDDDGTFQLTATVEVRPHFELPDVSSLQLPEFSLEVTDAEFDAELDKIREEHAAWEPEENAPAEDGMMVEADLHGTVVGGEGEPYEETGATFVVGAEGVPQEVSEALQGARPGDVVHAERDLPEDQEGDNAGKSVRYEIAVKELKRKVLPEADDDLAAAIGLDSFAALEERLREVLAEQKLAERRSAWRRGLLDQLAEGLDANELPSSLVQSTVRAELNRFAYTLAMRGVEPESEDINWQELAARYEPAARKKVMDDLILEQLADEWSTEEPEGDVDNYIQAEAGRLGLPPAEHKANLAKENKLGGIRHAARIAATLDEVIRRAGGEA